MFKEMKLSATLFFGVRVKKRRPTTNLMSLIRSGCSDVKFASALKGVSTTELIEICKNRGLEFNCGASRMVMLSSLYQSYKM